MRLIAVTIHEFLEDLQPKDSAFSQRKKKGKAWLTAGRLSIVFQIPN